MLCEAMGQSVGVMLRKRSASLILASDWLKFTSSALISPTNEKSPCLVLLTRDDTSCEVTGTSLPPTSRFDPFTGVLLDNFFACPVYAFWLTHELNDMIHFLDFL